MKTMRRLLFALLAVLAICSCDNTPMDGDWPPMKWDKTNYQIVKEDNSSYYLVPAEGGTFTFHCKNYNGFWIGDGRFEYDGQVWHLCEVYEENANNPNFERDWHHFAYNWIEVTAKKDAVLEVVFQPNDGAERKADITVTAGDIFYTFAFKQSGK